MKTLKAEEVNGKKYLDIEDARGRVGAFIDDVYNARRIHSAIGCMAPTAFEKALRQANEPETVLT